MQEIKSPLCKIILRSTVKNIYCNDGKQFLYNCIPARYNNGIIMVFNK